MVQIWRTVAARQCAGVLPYPIDPFLPVPRPLQGEGMPRVRRRDRSQRRFKPFFERRVPGNAGADLVKGEAGGLRRGLRGGGRARFLLPRLAAIVEEFRQRARTNAGPPQHVTREPRTGFRQRYGLFQEPGREVRNRSVGEHIVQGQRTGGRDRIRRDDDVIVILAANDLQHQLFLLRWSISEPSVGLGPDVLLRRRQHQNEVAIQSGADQRSLSVGIHGITTASHEYSRSVSISSPCCSRAGASIFATPSRSPGVVNDHAVSPSEPSAQAVENLRQSALSLRTAAGGRTARTSRCPLSTASRATGRA